MFQRGRSDLLTHMKGGKKKLQEDQEKMWRERLSSELNQGPSLNGLSPFINTSNGLVSPSMQQQAPALQSFLQQHSSLSGLGLFNQSLQAPPATNSSEILNALRMSQLQQQAQAEANNAAARELQLRLLLVNQQEELSALARMPRNDGRSALFASQPGAAPLGQPALSLDTVASLPTQQKLDLLRLYELANQSRR